MTALELLAPARNADIGIAAIDCGADAVYIGGPGFGARKDAGNPIAEVGRLCEYAHRFSAKVYMTVNIALKDEELPEVHSLMLEAQKVGVDAFIIRDERICRWDDITVPLHASTQCAIRTPERARQLEAAGCRRIVLERELSLEQMKAIREAVNCEIEVFVHGALCVCYSGECRLSEYINGRSADRGECIQACRSLYDLVDGNGKLIAKGKALLSLKDLNLKNRMEELAAMGAMSFKIEGRLKNASYVKNVTREYSDALDAIVEKYPELFRRASLGHPVGGFIPDSRKTFNRGYTELYLDGRRGDWSSMHTTRSIGERIGSVLRISEGRVEIRPDYKKTVLNNGDGFAFASGDGLCGFRADTASGNIIRCRVPEGLKPGMTLYRNLSTAFERELESNICRREIAASLKVSLNAGSIRLEAVREDGVRAGMDFDCPPVAATSPQRTLSMLGSGLSKHSGAYAFTVESIACNTANVPFVKASFVNGMRAAMAEMLNQVQHDGHGVQHDGHGVQHDGYGIQRERQNVQREGNVIAGCDPQSLSTDGVLMRSRYCIKYELGLCPRYCGAQPCGELFLLNNGRRFALKFDCRVCEMTVDRDVYRDL